MNKTLFLLAILSLALVSGAASAQSGDWYVAPSIVYADDDPDRAVQDDIAGLQIQVGRDITEHLSLSSALTLNHSRITEDEVNQILHQSVATQEKPRPKEMFEQGERIRITDGPFASFNGVVEEVNFDRSTVKVMVTIFGRETPVEIEFRQVQKLS